MKTLTAGQTERRDNQEMIRDLKRHPLLCLCIGCLLLFISSSPCPAAQMPAANREAAEKFFGRAYEQYCSRDYEGALFNLERAIEQNTFLVDYYLMKGLVLHRTGRFAEAARAVSHFLEVRPGDKAAPKILSRYMQELAFLDTFLSGRALLTRTSSHARDINLTLDISLLQNRGFKGLGKARSSPTGALALADQLGNRLLIKGPGEKTFTGMEIESPVVFLFQGGNEGIVLSETGRVFRFDGSYEGLTELEKLPFSPSDGAMVKNNLFIATSASARRAALFSLPDMTLTAEIDFPDTQAPFEPSSAAVFGEWAAVADRNNGLIFIISLNEKKAVLSFSADSPRDLAWSPLGELYIVHDTGSVSKTIPDLGKPEVVRSEVVLMQAPDAWSLFFQEDRAYCLDVGGFSLWELFSYPEGDSPGFFSLDSPAITREADRESFLLKAAVTGPFQTYMSKNRAVATAVWNDRMLTASYSSSGPDAPSAPPEFFIPPGNLKQENLHEAASGKEILEILEGLWKKRGGGLRDVAVSASIPFNDEDMLRLAGFCLQNSIRLSVYADAFPRTSLMRACALTGGSPLYSLREGPAAPSFSRGGMIRIPLPADETSSGFPSRSVITVYLDMGAVSLRDWMPLWPDLL